MSMTEMDISPGFETQVAITPILFRTTKAAQTRFTPEERGCYFDQEINLTYLLELLEKILKDSKFLDLRICGSAAVTSSLIYRLKVENLFMKERELPRKQINYSGPLEIPTILNLLLAYFDTAVSTIKSNTIFPVYSQFSRHRCP